MSTRLDKYKGLHPGAVIERELKKRNLSQRAFALSVGEHPQTFHAILKGDRKLNTGLGLKIEQELGFDESDLLTLQLLYDIAQQKRKDQAAYHPNMRLLRRSLFWDTDMDKIDWRKHERAVINRVFERGNATEKQEISRFYGEGKVAAALNDGRFIKR